MGNVIRLTKGGKIFDIDAVEVSEDYTNKLIVTIPNILQESKQDGSLPDKKIIDLLWITHTFQIRGNIVGRAGTCSVLGHNDQTTCEADSGNWTSAAKTAKQVKDEIITIFKGAETAGGSITMTYDGDTFNGYIEKMVVIEKTSDNPDSLTEDIAKYGIQITFIEGKSPSGG